ncbi:MAG: CBS domain-containing protein [Polyangiaceae bacterium]
MHRNAFILDVLQGVHAKDVLPELREFATFSATTPASQMLSTLAESEQQDVFPVVEGEGRLIGLVTAGALKVMAVESDGTKWMIATDSHAATRQRDVGFRSENRQRSLGVQRTSSNSGHG